MLIQSELAYIAAVIDTNARIKLLKTDAGSMIPVIHMSCPNMDLLEFLGKMSGIKAFETKRDYKRHGCKDHCPERHLHIRSLSGRWSVSGAKATIMLHELKPFIRFQKEAVEEAIAAGLEAPHKRATVDRMKALGWRVPPGW